MALLGTLKGFGVTEIFQLISQQMKTGTLVLTSPEATISLGFNNGTIEGIKSDKWEMDPRADLLLKAGFILEKDLKAAFDGEKKNSHKWHDILISQGKLKQTFLDRASNVVIRTILLEVFQWKEGNYKFEDWEVDGDNLLPCHVPTEGVILDTLRVIDEWPLVKGKIPPVDYCPVTIMPLTEELVKKYRLSAVDMHIFDLIDEKRTVQAIIRQSLEPSFEALSSLVKLIDCGLVEVFPQGIIETRDSSIAKRVFLLRVKKGAAIALLVITLAALAFIGHPRIIKGDFIPENVSSSVRIQKELAQDYARQGIWLSKLGTGTDSR
ncbi:MAG TPA: DUF4388 domain-containing protein [Deltaproteobacteria bacterium]|jgi:hypothetical protein|nr:DUF4388 domain-containing protein [Deltaproteobacteria bacterium]HOI07287.1 DUF4388 domain-containing protein [Deltaproteobacteria bacterium]